MVSVIESALYQKARTQKRLTIPKVPEAGARKGTKHLERRYAKQLEVSLLQKLEKAAQTLREQIPGIALEARRTLGQRSDSERFDDYSDEVDRVFKSVRLQFTRSLTDEEIERIAARQGVEVSALNQEILDGQMKRVIGVAPFVRDPALNAMSKEFIKQNVSLIKSIGSEYFDKLEQDTYRMITRGVHNRAWTPLIEAQYAEEFEKQYNEGVLKRRVQNARARANLIARDQTLTFYSQVNQQRQIALGINKYRWNTVGDDRVRETHEANNGKVFSWDDPPATGHPGEEINCLIGDTEINALPNCEKVFRRWYTGKLTKIVTTSGKTIYLTPNHPIFCETGKVPANELKIGQNIFEIVQKKSLVTSPFNYDRTGVRISDIFESASKFGIRQTVGAGSQFHGDGSIDYNVDIVSTKGDLWNGVDARFFKRKNEFLFSKSDMVRIWMIESSFASSKASLIRFLFSFYGLMTGLCLKASLFLSHLRPFKLFGLTLISNLNTRFFQKVCDCRPADPKFFANRINAISRQVHGTDFKVREINSIVSTYVFHIETFDFSGYVYNLQTSTGEYVANNILVGNCRCFPTPVIDESVTDNPELQALLNKAKK